MCTDDELEDKKPLIVSGLKIVLHDQTLKVRKYVRALRSLELACNFDVLTKGYSSLCKEIFLPF